MTHGGGGVLFCSFISSLGIAVSYLPHNKNLIQWYRTPAIEVYFIFFAFVFSSLYFPFPFATGYIIIDKPFQKGISRYTVTLKMYDVLRLLTA
jgi:hypothetical protein